MDGYIQLERAAALERTNYDALLKRCQRNRIPLAVDPDDGRRKLFPVERLSPLAWQQWQREEVSAAGALAPMTSDLSAPPLPFAAAEPEQPPALAAIPEKYQVRVEAWMGILGDCLNHRWKKFEGTIYGGVEIHTKSDFIRATADIHRHSPGFSVSAIYEQLDRAKKILSDPAVPNPVKWARVAEGLKPRPRPGRSGYSFFADLDNAWQWAVLRGFYLNQARLSEKRAWELLLEEIGSRERAAQGTCIYHRPSLRQARTALAKISEPERVLAREGSKAFNDKCGRYISRRPPKSSADIYVTDQKLFDVRLRDGGEKLGRIWMVSFFDVASWRSLGRAYGPCLSSEMVMNAALAAITRGGLPLAVHRDLGKEFQSKMFNGKIQSVRGETLYRESEGFWERTGVKTIDAIGMNPQSKTIERFHSEIDRFCQELPGWTGRNPDERPEVTAALEAEHEAWKDGRARRTRLLRIEDFINRFEAWCEFKWNARHQGEGKYLRGMTPNQAWNVKVPPGGFRYIDPVELELKSADHRWLKVARGGQINLRVHGISIEYIAPELFLRQGQNVEVVLSRSSIAEIVVLDSNGQEICRAHPKPQYEWMPDDREQLRAAIRCKAAMQRAVKRGIEAQRLLVEARNPAELPQSGFGAPIYPLREISSSEWMMNRKGNGRPPKAPHTETSGGLARRLLEMEGQ